MVITNQISIIDTQKKRKKPKHNTKDSHQITREGSKRRRKKPKRTTKQFQNSQQNGNKTYLTIIALNVNGLNAPVKRRRLAERTQKQDLYICCLHETHFRSKDIQTERESIGKGIPCKCKS